MICYWEVGDIQPGLAVVNKEPNGKYRTPCMIGFCHLPGGCQYGLVDLRDGMFMIFGDGSKARLSKHLYESGYMPALKTQGGETENRLAVPVVRY